MKMHLIKIFLLLISTYAFAYENLQLIKKENPGSDTTLLVIGGIHGNEPGGYFSASILATHYKINSKNLWVVPNLNQKSIRVNRRGIHGDMNRKFAKIKKNDKDAAIVKDIKNLILEKNVSLILNLHDGHGFYRKKNQGSIFNPNAWGQTCVIDQCTLPKEQPFGNLDEIAQTVKKNLNKNLLQGHHTFDIRNTNTKFDDESMQLSLTYFAVTHNKPAFAIETSKNLSSLSSKVFYQLIAIEEFMKIMDISFTRDFDLSQKTLRKIIEDYGTLEINKNILFNLNGIKNYLSYIPIESNNNVFEFSHPLGDFRKENGKYIITIGNKVITTLKPQYFKIATDCPKTFDVEIDGERKTVDAASEFSVEKSFKIIGNEKYRVNVIGFVSPNGSDESNVDITLKSISDDFSVDKDNKVYRVEFYNNDDFCSMSTVHFK